jgi:hypothetical protein
VDASPSLCFPIALASWEPVSCSEFVRFFVSTGDRFRWGGKLVDGLLWGWEIVCDGGVYEGLERLGFLELGGNLSFLV